jgi:hypothetical protein
VANLEIPREEILEDRSHCESVHNSAPLAEVHVTVKDRSSGDARHTEENDMPLKSAVDPRTGKLKTYGISLSGRVISDGSRLVAPGDPLPPSIKKAARKLKEESQARLQPRTATKRKPF